ncbi:RNA-directed DNA polymerase [Sorangium sp. So ce1335]|uniref:RNA-directed DNA polymerase n=1 Tax=Sorangium sp. So ce1335 TaxID=3133335 RepID=UPI003F5F9BA8
MANYFDSIQHTLLFDCLAQYGLPREVTGILGKLLDVLRPRAGHSPTPHVGLPVDFYDCSRPLAHVFLFEHDRHMIKQAGNHNYVRWMDDQTIIVPNRTRARHTVRHLVQSLNRHRLTLNSGKTKFLSPVDVEQTFHLTANDELDVLEQLKSADDFGGIL